jgi:hypothetical protein
MSETKEPYVVTHTTPDPAAPTTLDLEAIENELNHAGHLKLLWPSDSDVYRLIKLSFDLLAEVKRLREVLKVVPNWMEITQDYYEEIAFPHVQNLALAVLEGDWKLVNEFLTTRNTKLLEP